MPLMFSPSNNHDREYLLKCVVGRVPLHLVVDNTSSPYDHIPMGYEAADRFSPCGQSLVWSGPRIPRVGRPPLQIRSPQPPRRSRWGRLLRDLRRFLLSPRAS